MRVRTRHRPHSAHAVGVAGRDVPQRGLAAFRRCIGGKRRRVQTGKYSGRLGGNPHAIAIEHDRADGFGKARARYTIEVRHHPRMEYHILPAHTIPR